MSDTVRGVHAAMREVFDRLPHDDGLFWKPSRMRVVQGRHRTCDVLVLTRYGLGPADIKLMEASLGETTMFNWSFYCALALDSEDNFVRGARSDKLRMRNGDALPWGKWFVDALRAIRPKVVVVMEWFENGGNDFEAHWPQFNVPLRYKDAIHVMHPKQKLEAFKQTWAEEVAPALERTSLVGAKRISDGPLAGSIDAFSVMCKRARQIAPSPAMGMATKDPNAPRQLTGSNFDEDEDAQHALSLSPVQVSSDSGTDCVGTAVETAKTVPKRVPGSGKDSKSEDTTTQQDAESFWE